MQKVAIIQESSVFLDRVKTIEKAVKLVEKAAAADAELVVFPEAFISGYPAWIWRLRPGSDWSITEDLHAQLYESAVDLGADDLALLCKAAKKNKVTIICGINECEKTLGQATLYNTVVMINTKGKIINRHRKVMPTNPERMVWGFGDGSGLKVLPSPIGRIGSLICWENYMPLARYSLYAQGIEIYVAPTYDSGDDWIGTLQHIAREGRCWVLGSGVVINHSDIPNSFPDKENLYPDTEEWINPGDSIIIAPGGEIVAGPIRNEKGILYAVLDLRRVTISKRDLDVTGHYSRPDIFEMSVNRQVQSPIKFK